MVTVAVQHASSSLNNTRVSFTGKLAFMSQREAFDVVRAAGGTPTHTLSRRTGMLVIGMYGWPLLPDGQVSSKLRMAESLRRQGHDIALVSEAAFLERVGLRQAAPEGEKSYSRTQICALLDIDSEVLARWEQLSLVQSDDGRFDFQDVVSLRTVADLMARGVRPETINRSLNGLAAVLPGTDRPLAQLKIVEDSPHTLLAELEDALMAADGQLLLNFDRPRSEDAVLTVEPTEHDATAWFEYGQICEEDQRYAEAAEAYGQAIALKNCFPEAHFNLGNVVRATGSLDTALMMYRAAVDQDETLACGWYNIADIYQEQGRVDEAITALSHALEVAPDYHDAHFNLARCYEQVGDASAAARHWQAYLSLDADSQWAMIARSHLLGLESV